MLGHSNVWLTRVKSPARQELYGWGISWDENTSMRCSVALEHIVWSGWKGLDAGQDSTVVLGGSLDKSFHRRGSSKTGLGKQGRGDEDDGDEEDKEDDDDVRNEHNL